MTYLALDAYDRVWGTMPLAASTPHEGAPANGWRFSLVPFLIATKHPYDPQMPWTASDNQHYRENPSLSRQFLHTNGALWQVAVVGPQTPFRIAGSLSLRESNSDCIVVIEATRPCRSWMDDTNIGIEELLQAGDDATASDLGCGVPEDRTGFYVLFADGSIERLSLSTPVSVLLPFVSGEIPPDRSALVTASAEH